jgi:hypothetical protein
LLVVTAAHSQTAVPVTVTFRDDSLDNIRSDGQGPYAGSQPQVGAYIQIEGGYLVLSTDTNRRKAGGRSLFFDFAHAQCLTLCDETPMSTGYSTAGVLVKPLTPDGSAFATNGLLGIPIGQERRTWLKIRILDFADEWTLCFHPAGITDMGGICAVSASSTPARVVRISQGTWQIFGTAALAADGQRSDAASLLKTTTIKGKSTTTVEGTYSMPFLITVTCMNEADCPVLN